MKTPYKWQTMMFKKCKDYASLMLKVCCGGGKSFATVMLADYKKLPTVIIAPKNLCVDTWEKELIDYGVPKKDIFVFDQKEYSRNKEDYEQRVAAWLNQ